MFRATLQEEADRVVMKLEGSLTGAFVDELEEFWSRLRREPMKPLVIDLESTTFVNAAGKHLLAMMYQSGAQLVGRGPLTRAMVESIVETASAARH